MANYEFVPQGLQFSNLESLEPGLVSVHMKILALLLIHVLTKVAMRLGPGGAQAIIAECVLVKHQRLFATNFIRHVPIERLMNTGMVVIL
jgi:hypothetical protein